VGNRRGNLCRGCRGLVVLGDGGEVVYRDNSVYRYHIGFGLYKHCCMWGEGGIPYACRIGGSLLAGLCCGAIVVVVFIVDVV